MANIDGPVGMRDRIKNVRNLSKDQVKIIELLRQIPKELGGKKEEWGIMPLAGSDGSCPPILADAIWDFQTYWKHVGVFKKIDGVVDPGGNTLYKLNQLASGTPAVFIVRDVRLFGWKPFGDVLDVNGDTPLQWVVGEIVRRGKANQGNLVVKFMCHGVPGFAQCARGSFPHPTLQPVFDNAYTPPKYIGPGSGGICIHDLPTLSKMAGVVRRIEFHSCLIARMGTCSEANGHTCYDGNAFCFRLAQTTQAEVKASIHLQAYWGRYPSLGMHFGSWNGRVFTWGPGGNILKMEDFPYLELNGPPPPGTPPL